MGSTVGGAVNTTTSTVGSVAGDTTAAVGSRVGAVGSTTGDLTRSVALTHEKFAALTSTNLFVSLNAC